MKMNGPKRHRQRRRQRNLKSMSPEELRAFCDAMAEAELQALLGYLEQEAAKIEAAS
ncbi:MAG TPA: hypothetical protein VNF91_10755 [Candidatus Acidoferrum sp.]|nr:hypothetical protein [Candidatus Acidoferrum sp.]